MANNNELKLVISGDASNAMGILDQFGRAVKGTTDGAMGQFGALGKIIENFAAPIAAVTALLGGGAIFKGNVDAAVELGKEVGQLQRVLGLSASEASVLSIAIGDIFGDADGFLAGAAKMTKVVGSNEAAIKRLGVQVRDSSGNFRAMPVLISEINGKLGEFKEGTDRDVEAQKVYGKSYQEMLRYIALTPEVMDAARKKSEELGLGITAEGKRVVKGYRDMGNDVGDVLQALRVRVGLQVMPALTELGNWFASVGPPAINATVGALGTVGEVLSYTTVKVGLLAIAVQGLGGAALLRGVMSLGSALAEVFSVAVLGTAGPLTALGARVAGLLNPVTLAIGAFAALAMGIEWLDKAGARDHARKMTDIADGAKQIASVQTLQKSYLDLARQLDSGKLSGAGKADALKALKGIQDQLVSISPSYRAAIDKETGSYVAQAAAIKSVTDESRKLQADKLAKLEADLKIAEDRENRLAAKSTNPGARNRYAKDAAEGESGAVIVSVDALRKASEHTANLRAEVDALRASIKAASEEPAPKGKHSATVPDEELASRKSNLLREIQDLRLAHLEKTTLAQQEAAEVAKFDSDLAKKRGDIAALARKDAAGATQATLLLDTVEHDGRIAIQEKYVRRRWELDDRTSEAWIDQFKATALKILDEEDRVAQERQSMGQISEVELLLAAESTGRQRYEIEKRWLEQRLELVVTGEKDQVETAKLRMKLQELEATHPQSSTRKGKGAPTKVAVLQSGAMGGIDNGLSAGLNKQKTAFEKWRDFVVDMTNGVRSSFASLFESIFQHGMTGGQKWDALWKGMSGTVVKGLADMGAAEVTHWVLLKAKAAWGIIRSAWETKDTAKTVTENDIKITSNTEVAASGFFATFAKLGPWGYALAAAAIISMIALLGNLQGREKGGPVRAGTPYIVGEAGHELFVPDVSGTIVPHHDLVNAHRNLGANLSRKGAQVEGLQAQAGSYARAAAVRASEGGGAQPYQDFSGSLIVTKDHFEFQELIHDTTVARAKRRG